MAVVVSQESIGPGEHNPMFGVDTCDQLDVNSLSESQNGPLNVVILHLLHR